MKPDQKTIRWGQQFALAKELSRIPAAQRRLDRPASLVMLSAVVLYQQLQPLAEAGAEKDFYPHSGQLGAINVGEVTMIAISAEDSSATYYYEVRENELSFHAFTAVTPGELPVYYSQDQVGLWRAHTALRLANQILHQEADR